MNRCVYEVKFKLTIDTSEPLGGTFDDTLADIRDWLEDNLWDSVSQHGIDDLEVKVIEEIVETDEA